MNTPSPTPGQLASCRDVLLALSRMTGAWPTNDPLLAEIAALCGQVRRRATKTVHGDHARRDADVRDQSGLTTGEAVPELAAFARPRRCAVCKAPHDRPHRFYHAMCNGCGEFNFAKRNQSADMTGRVALVTGGRIRSGYHVARKLLRAGAEVIVTTRFPTNARNRFEAESDSAKWMNRLHLFGLDLRLLPLVEEFCRGLVSRFPRLDVFVANAAQTVRRPPAYYRELAAQETQPAPLGSESTTPTSPRWGEVAGVNAVNPAGEGRFAGEDPSPGSLAALVEPTSPQRGEVGVIAPHHQSSSTPWFSALSLVPLLPDDHTADEHIPAGQFDPDGEPLDLRPANSWGLPQEQVSTVELIEVQAVNVMSPFVMLRELRPLFRREPGNKFAVVVSASEGRFAADKSGHHPHTNMAKAAVNMLVRTSAEEFAADRVYLSAVDPGWFSVQSAAVSAERMHAAGGRLPLDAEDAAARILDPVFAHLHADPPPHGVLFKDYRPAEW